MSCHSDRFVYPWAGRAGSVAALAAVLALSSPSAAAAADGSIQAGAADPFAPPPLSWIGAQTLPEGESAVIASVGLPDVEVAWLHGLTSLADIAPRLRLQAGRAVRLAGGGVTLGATMRLQLAEIAGWRLALVSDPELVIHLYGKDNPPTTRNGALALGITGLSGQVVVSRAILADVRLAVSVGSAVTAFLAPELAIAVPLVAGLGAEVQLSPTLSLFSKIDSGFDVYALGSVDGSRAYLRARVGLGWVL